MKHTDADLVKKYKVTKFPTFLLLKNKEKPLQYPGESYTYSELFEFINIYSETFVFVGDQEQKEVKSAASKTWLNVKAPYLTKDSGNDVCLKKDGTLCVVYVLPNAADSSDVVMDALDQVKSSFMSKIERGITFSFVRLDASREPQFASIFTDNSSSLPMIAVMNPGKRKRYLKHEGGFSVVEITSTLDKILGGDAKFKAIKDNEL